MSAIKRNQIYLERYKSLLDLVDSMNEEEIREMAHEIQLRCPGYASTHEYIMLIHAWTKINPEAAMDHVYDHIDHHPVTRQQLLQAWSVEDPESALEWAKKRDKDNITGAHVTDVICSLASKDPQLATDMLEELPESRSRSDALYHIAKLHLSDKDPDTARSWSLGIKNDALRASAIRTISRKQSKNELLSTADWLLGIKDEASAEAITDVMWRLAQQDQQAALTSMEGANGNSNKMYAFAGITRAMAINDPRATLSLIKSNQALAGDEVWSSFATFAVSKEPELAIDAISSIQNLKNRNHTYSLTLSKWLRYDSEAALNWISQNELSPEVRANLDRHIERIKSKEKHTN